MSWYKKGEDGYQEVVSRQQLEEEERSRRVIRFWLREGERAKVTFLDDEGFFYQEHHLKLRGRWGNFFTCPADFSECPICESGERASSVAAFTIIDHTPYVIRNGPNKGKTVQHTKKLLVVKRAALHKLMDRKRKLAKDGGLKLGVFELARFSAQECNTGEQFDYLGKRIPLDKLKTLAPKGVDPDEWVKPFDYMTILAPLSTDDLRLVAKQSVFGADVGSPASASAAPVVGDDDLFGEETETAASGGAEEESSEEGEVSLEDLL